MNESLPNPDALLANIRIVLVETSHPGNIGATARAMKNMGLGDLRLYRPLVYPHADATARASGADDVLAGARLANGLEELVGDCSLVLGTSARLRSLVWPTITPREAAQECVREAASGKVAVLFGREKSGLTNDEIYRCRKLVHIPANDGYSSLNLAMAVQILSYEIRMAATGARLPEQIPESPPASAAETERFFEHLQRVLIEVDFLDPDHPRHLMARLRRLFARTGIDQNEANILRGILSAVEKFGNKD